MRKLLLLAPFFALTACSSWQGGHPNYASSTLSPGESITIDRDQTVYAVAQKYKVPMNDIIALNGLRSPYILRKGQNLTLPSGTGMIIDGGGVTNIGLMPAESSVSRSLTSSGAVTVEELPPAGVAVSAQPLSSVQPPLPAPAVRPGTPSAAMVQSMMVPAEAQGPLLAPPAAVAPQPSVAETAPVSLLPSVPPVDAAVPAASAVSPAMGTTAAPRLAWPVDGPVLKPYGAGNDGVNIGAPRGAPVVASSSGTVVYADGGMKGFGNLVLIRHEGGWVTAYAHLDRMVVDKDAVVAAGDMIGTVGQTGGVGSPQLHFEVRRGTKPVDPAPFLPARS